MGSATASSNRRPMMGHSGAGDDVAPPPPTLEFDDAKRSAGAWAAGGGSGSGGSGNDDPGVRSLVDLIELLHASENPLWDLIRFEVRHRNILAFGRLLRISYSDVSYEYEVTGIVCQVYQVCSLGESTRHPLLGQVTLQGLMEECSRLDMLTQELLFVPRRGHPVSQ